MDNVADPMESFDINEWLDDTEALEQAVDMHFSLYSIPSYYQETDY